MSGSDDARRLAEAVARRSYGKLVAILAARLRDVAAAEDALSEAFAAALLHWPVRGCPDNPEGWLMTAARRRLIDLNRRRSTADRFATEFAPADVSADAEIPDPRLALMFVCAHPAIEPGIRAPLMLQVVLGLDAARIASAFLMSPAAMSKRLGRAKDKIRRSGIPFRVPDAVELRNRLDPVLDAIYAAFADGWLDPGGTDLARRDLVEDALFLGTLAASLLPEEPEALGLLALMLHLEARRAARRTPDGEYVPLTEQDPALWDARLIDEAEALLLRASTMRDIGRYQLEGALQSAHVHRRRSGHADWPAVLSLYDALMIVSSSPVIVINRALVVAELHGPSAALAELHSVATDTRLEGYQPYWAARADLLRSVGDAAAAAQAYDLAIGLERDPAVRKFLQRRQRQNRHTGGRH